MSACRICLDTKCVGMVVLSEKNGWLHLFEYCFGLSLTSQDQPRSICEQCAENVKNFAKFKQLCLKSNDIWKLSGVNCYSAQNYYDNTNENVDIEVKSQTVNEPVSNKIGINNESPEIYNNRNFDNDFLNDSDYTFCTDIKVENVDEYKVNDDDKKEIDIPLIEYSDKKVFSNSHKVNSKRKKSADTKIKKCAGRNKTKNMDESTCKMCNKHYERRKCYLKHITECNPPERRSKPTINKSFNQTYAINCGRAYPFENVDVDNKNDIAKIKNEFLSIESVKDEIDVSCNEDNSLFVCGLCKLSFTTNSDVQKHLDEHWSNNDLSCKLCDFVGVDVAAMAAHRYYHYSSAHKKRFVCHICKAIKISLIAIHFHYRMVHLKKPGGICSRCNKEFTKLKLWKKHERSHSPGYICDICGKRYAYKYLIQDHMINHISPRTYICDTCGTVFQQARNLNRHMKAVHTDQCPVKCTHCNRIFKSGHSLSIHQKRLAREKLVKCEVCSKEFASLAFLKGHMVMHSDERPHCCDICGSRYKAKCQLKVHMRKHTGDLPFKCGVCGKQFPTSKQLKVHSAVHTGVRPFSCLHCDRTFYTRKLMLTHCAVTHSYKNETNVAKIQEKEKSTQTTDNII